MFLVILSNLNLFFCRHKLDACDRWGDFYIRFGIIFSNFFKLCNFNKIRSCSDYDEDFFHLCKNYAFIKYLNTEQIITSNSLYLMFIMVKRDNCSCFILSAFFAQFLSIQLLNRVRNFQLFLFQYVCDEEKSLFLYDVEHCHI